MLNITRVLRLTVIACLIAIAPGCHKHENTLEPQTRTLCSGLDSFLTVQIHRLEQGDEAGFSDAVPGLLIERMGFCAGVRGATKDQASELTLLSSEFSKTATGLADRIIVEGPITTHSTQSLADLRSMLAIVKKVNSYPIR